jgi:hypothetical protein
LSELGNEGNGEYADFVNYDVEHPAIATLIAHKTVVHN